jgi:hypothetical protein
MVTIGGQEKGFVGDDAQLPGKSYGTTAAVAAHRSQPAIGIKIHHFEIISFPILQQDQAIGADAQAAFTQKGYQLLVGGLEVPVAVVDHDKIVGGALIFIKSYFHFRLKLNLLRPVFVQGETAGA